MEPRTKSSLLWGLTGTLTYLVLVQGYHLVSDTFVGVRRLVLVAVLVGVLTTVLTYLLRPRLRELRRGE